jgi:transcriptional regulator with XRE-family HTH domain
MPRNFMTRGQLVQIVAANIRAGRTRRKWTQEQLADDALLSVSYISMLERGVREPTFETLCLLAGAFDTEPRLLLTAGAVK